MIGDLVMLSPAIRAIRQYYPKAYIALLGQPLSISTYKHHPGVNELISYDRSLGDRHLPAFNKALGALRERRFELAFIFHNSIGSALMARLGRIRERVGYRYECRDLFLTKRYSIPEKRQHLIETKADLLRMYGIPVDNVAEEVFIDHEGANQWLREKLGPNLGRNRPIVAISMGATKVYKRWSAAGLNKLLNMFPVNSCDFIFVGAPGDRELYENVYSYNNTVVDLVGQTTLEELTWVLEKVDLLICTDSGPMHLAIGRKTPVVALFGPTDPARCGPYKYEPSVVIRAEKLCSQCEAQHGKHIRQCLHTLNPEEVYYASIGLLAQYCPRWSIKTA